MTFRLTVEDCIAIYDQDIRAGVLVDRGRLEGAVEAPFSGTAEVEFFPTLLEKAARLTFGLAEAQAYSDGNKRLAWYCAVIFLGVNGSLLEVAQEEAAEAIWAIGRKTLNYDGLLVCYERWGRLRNNTPPDEQIP